MLEELHELAALDDPGFSARTQSKRVCGQAADAIEALLEQVKPASFYLFEDPEYWYADIRDYFARGGVEQLSRMPVRFMRSANLPDAWAVAVLTGYDEVDEPRTFDVLWFASEDEAGAWLLTNPGAPQP